MSDTVILRGQTQRDFARLLIDNACIDSVVQVSEPKRNKNQNARLWAMITDISKAQPEGRKHTAEDWKCLFMHACGWDVQFLEGFDGKPFPSGFRSSRMTVRQMADLMTFIGEYGDRHGVRWSEPNPYE